MIQENVFAIGNLSVVLTDEFGNIKDQQYVKNLVVDSGKAFIAGRMSATGTPTAMSNMALGSSSAAAATAQTTLTTETGRVALTSTSVTGPTITYVATFGAGVGTGAVNEAGIFNAATAGTMLNRTTFNTVNKGSSDTLSVSWAVTIQ